MENKIKKISYFRKMSPVYLQFKDLTYQIPQGRQAPKLILKNISGQFRAGQLCAILGSSGSGKTTLLNVLAGYKTSGADGTLLINGRPFVFKDFTKLSRYILQENLLQSYLTVQEYMSTTADLKLGGEFSREDKVLVISEILEILRLTSARDTLSNNLSGGERKRLSIALELINNPSVIFLDEPTTGLDDLSSSQCISLLKALAEGGRTVICSIHTPSARNFEKFDNVFVMAEGMCVYQGCGRNIVPFLSNLGLSCPKHYNPADFVIEVTTGQYGDQYVEKMSEEMENGRNASYFNDTDREIAEIDDASGDSPKIHSDQNECFRQFKILLHRRCLQMSRNKQHLLFKIVVSILTGIIFGSFYFDLGQNASKIRFNAPFCFTSLASFLYLIIMPICLNFPTEIKLMQREYFNKWYGLTAYYLAMTVATLPLQVIMITLCIGISYIMSAQPMELDRFILTMLICWLVTLVADSHGLIIASIFNITNGSFAGPISIMPFLLIAAFGIGEYSKMSTFIQIAMHCSYVRYGYEGFLLAIFGNGRSFLECPEEEIVCLLKDPKKFLDFVGLQNTFIWIDIVGLIIWFFIFRIAGFYLLWIRLQANHPFRSVKYLVQNFILSKDGRRLG